MTDWIPATRTEAGYYADEKPLRYSAGPTCTQRQDAELARHGSALEELFSIVTRLAQDVSTLRERVSALEAQPAGMSYAIPARTATPNQTYSWLPGDAWSNYCAAVDGEYAEIEGETPLGIAWDRSTFRFTPYFDEDSDDGPDPMEDV